MNYLVMQFQMLVLIVCMMLIVAFFSMYERKVLGYIHFRKGPNKVIIMGLSQPFADAIKLIAKDDSPVLWSNKLLYYVSPLLMYFVSMVSWWCYPELWNLHSLKYSFIFLIMILGSTIYGVLLSGWSSNSKYSVLGSMRAVALSISYEVVLSFVFLSLMTLFCSFKMMDVFDYHYTSVFLISPLFFFMFLISMMAELGRSPFDLSEGESELVSGYSVEYGGISYTLIFLSENMMIVFSSFILSFFMFPDYLGLFHVVKFMLILTLLCLIRGIVPRIRYDYLMIYCWVVLMPLVIVLFNFFWLLKYI